MSFTYWQGRGTPRLYCDWCREYLIRTGYDYDMCIGQALNVAPEIISIDEWEALPEADEDDQ